MCVSGYQCEYKKRTGSKPDGCAIVFKSSRLSLLSSNPVEFLRPGDALLDRDNVGLVVLLQPTDGPSSLNRTSSICVANTHLLYNPRRGDIKLAQLAILLAEIGQLSRLPNGSTSPVVLCGDFNSTPLSPLYRFLTTGCLHYSGLRMGSVSYSVTADHPTHHHQLIGQISVFADFWTGQQPQRTACLGQSNLVSQSGDRQSMPVQEQRSSCVQQQLGRSSL